MRNSDAGRALWHVYMGLDGKLPDRYKRNKDGSIYQAQTKTFGEICAEYENMGRERDWSRELKAEQRRRRGSDWSSEPFDDKIPGL